ncbi:MAG: PA2169 family four-helix-bundle protein [Erythrobacter sp.]|uniref:PA2169 family four-helix-bundle protein n=1 Tax=Erythrobacter sp. TaxID=1042 RepID=UPI003C76C15C
MKNISKLKDLTQTTYDSVKGYRKAIEKADSPALRSALDQRLSRRQQTLAKLNTALTNNGEKTINDASMTGSAHQLFTSIADAFESDDEAAVERVEEGEDYISGQFRDALKDDDIDAALRPIIEDAYSEIRDGERFSDMLEKQYA